MAIEVQTEVSGTAHHRQVLVDGQPVGRLTVHDLSFWMLGVQVRTGAIGGVHTEREQRRKGYSRHLLEDTLRYMAGRGQETSMLFGIPDFYDKFGYAPFMPEHLIRVATRDAERSARRLPGHRVRPMHPEDRAFILDLYERDNRLTPGALVRNPDAWTGFRMGSNYDRSATALVLEDADGGQVAYAAIDDRLTDVIVTEASATEPSLHPALLQELTTLAIERRCGHLEFHAPPDHPFARFLTRCGCQATADYPRMGGGMLRVINQDALFGKLEPALADRIEQSRLAGSRVALRVETDLATSELQLGPRRARRTPVEARVALPQHMLTQLMVGYRRAVDVLSEPGVESSGEACTVLDVLFGAQGPYVWRADRF